MPVPGSEIGAEKLGQKEVCESNEVKSPRLNFGHLGTTGCTGNSLIL